MTAAYIVAAIGLAAWLQPYDPEAYMLGMTLLTAALVFIAWRKTKGGWRWRWGDPD